MSINRDEWLAAVQTAENITDDPNAVTIAEFGVLLGLRATAAKDRMRELVVRGKATQVRKRVQTASGRPQFVPAYVLVKETPDVLSRLEAPDARRLRRTRSRPRT